jgi:anti-sigma-K factor RskA
VTERQHPPGHEGYRDELAAYALGAIEEGEAAELQRHLAGCEDCRRYLRWLEPAVDLLPRTVPQIEPPARLRKRLLAEVRAESGEPAFDSRRERLRAWIALAMRPATAVAAGALLVAGAIGGYLLHQPGEGSSVVAARPIGSSASGTLARQDGSAILHVEGMPPLAGKQVYETWVRRGHELKPSSLFVLRSNRSGDAAIPGPLEGADAVLVTKEPRGGSQHPTSRPILAAPLG